MESTPVLRRRSPQRASRGFTIVEMLVVLAIIAIITAVTVTGQSTFNKTLILTDTTYGVALSARQAQSYGLASRKFGSVQNPGYGLHFNNSTPNSYIVFADTSNALQPPPPICPLGVVNTPSAKPGNCRFDVADGMVGTYTFDHGFHVYSVCAKSAGLPALCSNTVNPLTSLDIVFTRPNTTAAINGLVSGTILNSFSCAEITITDSSETAFRSIRISSLGEISVNQHCS